jgi:hypothetical protein
LAHLFRPHIRVGEGCGAGEAAGLQLAGPLHPLTDRGGGLAGAAFGELLVRDARDIEVDVDAVQERAADALLVAGDGAGGAGAGTAWIAVVATGATV